MYFYWVNNVEFSSENDPIVPYRDLSRDNDLPNFIEDRNGGIDQLWYKDGALHRDNNPAHIDSVGTKKWYKFGKLHRDDGPAIEWYDGMREWYLNGFNYGWNLYLEQPEVQENKLLIVLTYGGQHDKNL